VSQPQLPLPDVPLIVEDLLTEAKRLADAGADREEIEEILDQVEQLRPGRG
jgi:fatty acid-binding protein DegV